MIGAGGITKVVRGFQMAFPGKKEKENRENPSFLFRKVMFLVFQEAPL